MTYTCNSMTDASASALRAPPLELSGMTRLVDRTSLDHTPVLPFRDARNASAYTEVDG